MVAFILAITLYPSLMLTLALSGDVFCLRVFGQAIVVLNSLSAIKDLLEKRGEIHSDRPMFPTAEMCV
jgi:hypothetical protein